MRQSGPLETVAIVHSQSELGVLLSFLAGHDIWVTSSHYHQVAAQWPITIALGGVPLQVSLEDAEAARHLLSGVEPAPWARGIYTSSRLLDLILLVLLAVTCFAVMPAPARIPAYLVGGRTGGAHRRPTSE
jgi:hypothetical protein